MQILEAIIAFALTLAALATIVTTIMEAGMRTARMRKKNLIEVMKLLNKELEFGSFKLDPAQRWSFIESVISNPVNTATASVTDVLSEKLKIPGTTNPLQNDQLNEILNLLGSGKGAGEKIWIRVTRYLRQFFGDPVRSSVYDKVSLEHVLRRLVEVDVVQKASLAASDEVKVELNRLARKYEEFASAASANFKRYAQRWSMIIGIAFAVLANVNGLRIFDAYLVNPELANTVITSQQQFVDTDTDTDSQAQNRISALTKAEENLEKAKIEFDKTNKDFEEVKSKPELEDDLKRLLSELEKKRLGLIQAQNALDELASPDQINKLLQDAQLQYVNLTTLGVPMGWSMFPDCPYGGETAWLKSDQKCQSIPKAERDPDNRILYWLGNDSIVARVLTTAHQDLSGFIQWLLLTIFTGMLIGLGAPFWFDVVKRLSQIRQGVRSRASGEERMAANNADGDPKKRNTIVENVVMDAAADASLKMPGNKPMDGEP